MFSVEEIRKEGHLICFLCDAYCGQMACSEIERLGVRLAETQQQLAAVPEILEAHTHQAAAAPHQGLPVTATHFFKATSLGNCKNPKRGGLERVLKRLKWFLQLCCQKQ
jgi:hypothetical protein